MNKLTISIILSIVLLGFNVTTHAGDRVTLITHLLVCEELKEHPKIFNRLLFNENVPLQRLVDVTRDSLAHEPAMQYTMLKMLYATEQDPLTFVVSSKAHIACMGWMLEYFGVDK